MCDHSVCVCVLSVTFCQEPEIQSNLNGNLYRHTLHTHTCIFGDAHDMGTHITYTHTHITWTHSLQGYTHYIDHTYTCTVHRQSQIT